jgi:hypothetical protein
MRCRKLQRIQLIRGRPEAGSKEGSKEGPEGDGDVSTRLPPHAQQLDLDHQTRSGPISLTSARRVAKIFDLSSAPVCYIMMASLVSLLLVGSLLVVESASDRTFRVQNKSKQTLWIGEKGCTAISILPSRYRGISRRHRVAGLLPPYRTWFSRRPAQERTGSPITAARAPTPVVEASSCVPTRQR